tara:strand:+ start:204 stop:491 length:288 start_codon:yes stop_codon:yes gene_type:complete
MESPIKEIRYIFPIFFNLLIGDWDWIINRRAIGNKQIEMTAVVEFGSVEHLAMERLNDAVISEALWEKYLKENYEEYAPDYDITPPIHPEERKGI